MRRIVRSRQADEDLLGIWFHIALDNPAAADRTVERIENRWLHLLDLPYSGMARDDIAPGLRQLVAGSYLILHRVSGDAVHIVRVLHVRRDVTDEAVEPVQACALDVSLSPEIVPEPRGHARTIISAVRG